MLKKQYRLPAHTKLQAPFSLRTPLFSVKIAKNGLPYNRFAFVVRKAVDKRAIRRNRMKRVIRSCIEELLGEMRQGYDMLFFLEKGIIEKHHGYLSQEIRKVLTEKGLI